MTKLSYYPGCTLKTKAKELDIYARRCAEVLGVILEEQDEWQCCGGVFSTATDEIASKLSSIRTLAAAKEKNQALVTVCSACHNVIKQTNHAIQTTPDFAFSANNYMMSGTKPCISSPYNGETQVYHYLEMLRDIVGYDNIKASVKKPLNGKKIAAYYGCLLLRPSKIMQMDDSENPSIMENLIRAIGAEPVIYPYRNECCGGYVALENTKLVTKKSSSVTESAENMGADIIVTACPLCLYNLKKYGSNKIPVVYFTELLADALDVKGETV